MKENAVNSQDILLKPDIELEIMDPYDAWRSSSMVSAVSMKHLNANKLTRKLILMGISVWFSLSYKKVMQSHSDLSRPDSDKKSQNKKRYKWDTKTRDTEYDHL